MKVLIIGGGGREHALAWKCAAEPGVTEVLVAPGNAGTGAEPRVRNVAVAAEDIDALVNLARSENIALTIVGPEGPLVAGVVDAFNAAGLKCFGPTRLGARLEGSKAFCKDFLQRHRIPTAGYRIFSAATFDEAYVRARALPLVVKASGLAAGKGVVIADSPRGGTARRPRYVRRPVRQQRAMEVVIEDFLHGEERQLHRDGRRHACAAAGDLAGSQAPAGW